LYNNDLKLFEYLLTINTKEEIEKFKYSCEQYFELKRYPILHSINKEEEYNNKFFEHFFLSNHANILLQFKEQYGGKINSPAETLGWKIGRENFKQRTSHGIKTQLEINSNENRSINIKKDWESRNEKYIIERTETGLSLMNNIKYTCNICGKPNLTIGNLNRWHNTRCKFNEN
jgi:rubrerythrin